jgi:hypothetical protein
MIPDVLELLGNEKGDGSRRERKAPPKSGPEPAAGFLEQRLGAGEPAKLL